MSLPTTTNEVANAPVNSTLSAAPPLVDAEELKKVEERMLQYDNYLRELWKRFPDTYRRMQEFMRPDSRRDTYPAYNRVEHTVHVYDIFPKKKTAIGEFLKDNPFDVGQPGKLEELMIKLAADLGPDQKEPHNRQWSRASEQGQGSDEDENCVFAGEHCRVITVSHLTPEVLRLLGGIFNIPADFFNRHLPGTEAISGKLISRLPSTVQIDFDELYETNYTYNELFPNDKGREGYRKIDQAINKEFLFKMGWDYFPVSDMDWRQSLENKSLSSGFEIAMQSDLKNVFQFNLDHRVSVYSRPPGHPQTAIVIFYPMLQMQLSEASRVLKELPNDNKSILFRSNPNMLPNPTQLQKILLDGKIRDWELARHKQSYANAYDKAFYIHVKKHFEKDRHTRMKHPSERNTAQAQAIWDTQPESSVTIKSGQINRTSPLPETKDNIAHPEDDDEQIFDHPTFVHLFAGPLFKIVAANWARLIVRRSFDLDLLEWRPKELVTSRAIDEIKSRRVAITRHQRHINSSMEVLRALMLEELSTKFRHDAEHLTKAEFLAVVEGMCSWNRGRSNGLVADETGDDSWESIFWDFFELKASMDALEKRADKIHEGLIGLIQVVRSENSSTLNIIIALITVLLMPFTVIGNIYSSNLVRKNGREAPSRFVPDFIGALFITVLAVLASLAVVYYVEGKRQDWMQRFYWKVWVKWKNRWSKFQERRKSPVSPVSTPRSPDEAVLLSWPARQC